MGPVAAVIAGLIAVAPTATGLLSSAGDESIATDVEDLMVRIRALPAQGDRQAVFAWWDQGHQLQYLSRRPVLASPFGTEGGRNAMEDMAAFLMEPDPEAAERLLARRAVQYVLLDEPKRKAFQILSYGMRGPSGERFPFRLPNDLVSTRLFETLGSAVEGPVPRPALPAFRVVDEAMGPGGPVRLFEWVPGARVAVRACRPGAHVTASIELKSPSGSTSLWWTSAEADREGTARLRLPFASGEHGRFRTGSWTLDEGPRSVALQLSEAQVLGGAEVSSDGGCMARKR
jgi:hypothetical protein